MTAARPPGPYSDPDWQWPEDDKYAERRRRLRTHRQSESAEPDSSAESDEQDSSTEVSLDADAPGA